MTERAPFANKSSLITGGSSGIGLAIAQALAAQGAHVWLMARREEQLAVAVTTLERSRRAPTQRFGAISADVSQWSQVATAVAALAESAGVPDLLINSAGVAHPGYVEELDLDIFRWMMAVNYFGAVHATKAVLPGMIRRGSGHIVHVSSLAGILGVFGYTAYGASKFALRGFSDALRSELKPKGIAVSIAFPPDTDTPQLTYENRFKPQETRALAGNGGLMTAEAVAAAILDGVARGRYQIFPGVQSRLLYWLSSLLGGLQYPIMDWLVRRTKR